MENLKLPCDNEYQPYKFYFSDIQVNLHSHLVDFFLKDLCSDVVGGQMSPATKIYQWLTTH